MGAIAGMTEDELKSNATAPPNGYHGLVSDERMKYLTERLKEILMKKELGNELSSLKHDYDSCQLPQWDALNTLKTLDSITNAIKLGRLPLSDFSQYVEENLGQGDFAWGCLQYVKKHI